MEPVELLANAIVIQAADDYRMTAKLWHKADKRLKRARSKEKRKEIAAEKRAIGKELKSLERFFLGQWCAMLTTVDGGYILGKLKEEMRL